MAEITDEEVEDKEYKKWLDDYSNRHNKDFNGLERYSLTWVQIRKIIDEEINLISSKKDAEYKTLLTNMDNSYQKLKSKLKNSIPKEEVRKVIDEIIGRFDGTEQGILLEKELKQRLKLQ